MIKSREGSRSPVKQVRISFEKKLKRMRSPSNFNINLHNCNQQRLVIPRSKPSELPQKLYTPNIKSLDVSRHLIQEQQQQKPVNLQFSRRLKEHGGVHGRSRSNQVYMQGDQCQNMSNFSDSLQNISQQLIEIPFANKKITPNNKENGRNKIEKGIQFSNKKGGDERRGNKQRNVSADVLKPRRNLSKVSRNNSKKKTKQSCKGGRQLIPKSRKNTANKDRGIEITDFCLRALKITQSGSIIYFAIHKATRTVYAIKSIRKGSIRGKVDELMMEIKLGLAFGHPNYTKIYGLFSDQDNFYIIRQYLEEGCVADYRREMNERVIAQSLNHLLFAVSYLSGLLDMRLWSILPLKISRTHGIAKLTSLRLHLNGEKRGSMSVKEMIQWFFQSDDRRSTFQGYESLQFKSNRCSMLGRQSNSFLQLLQKLQLSSAQSILTLLQHPFLKQSRFKSTMQQ